MKQRMNTLFLTMLMLAAAYLPAGAQELPAGGRSEVPMPVSEDGYREWSTDVQVVTVADEAAGRESRRRERSGDHRVAIGSNAELPAGEYSDSVVAIAGDANVAGDVRDAVVAIMGNTMVDGDVGESVVTLFGNSYVNGRVDESVVTIFGNVELGPQAVVDDELVIIGGTLKRDPAAVVNRMQNIKALPFAVDFGWFRTWVKECLFYGRLLAFHPDVAWAWGVALVSLLLYVLTAALVPHSVARCVDTLETWPGRSVLAALLSIPLIPILLFLLVITVVGLLAVPVLGMALLVASWFGKLVMLGWIGKRLLQMFRMQAHWAWAVLMGGVIVTLVYTVPVVGLLSYKLLQFIGFGAVLYSLLLMFQKPSLQTGSAAPGAAAAELASVSTAEHVAADSEASVASSTPSNADVSQPAGFWLRMAALAIDVILIGGIAGLLDLNDVADHGLLLALAVYGALMWKLRGTTIGGIVCNLQVVRSDGREMDWSTSIVRALSCFLSLVALGLGFIWIAVDPARQAWHDKIAGTMVLRTRKGKPLV